MKTRFGLLILGTSTLAAAMGCASKQEHTNYGAAPNTVSTATATVQMQLDREPASAAPLKSGTQMALLQTPGQTSRPNSRNSAIDRSTVAKVESMLNDGRPSSKSCAPVEFAGMGPSYSDFSPTETEQAREYFERARRDLLSWLEKNKSKLEPVTYAAMKDRVERLNLLTRSLDEEPDLAWRGIGILSHDARGNGIVQLGNGFAELIKKEPDRARFEITRVVAQSWSPCEIGAYGSVKNPWKGYLQCMRVTDAQGCATDEYSEAGWAVSSAVALKLSKPKCEIPAFEESDARGCLDSLALATN